MVKRKYDIVVFDLDGVLVEIESSWVWLHEYFEVNNDDALRAYFYGEIDDLEFMRRDIALWHRKKARIHISEIERILSKAPLMKGVKETISRLKAEKIKTAIISGGLEQLGRNVANRIGIDYVLANGLEVDEEGYLLSNGILNVEIADKGKALLMLLTRLNIKPSRCVAVGNSYIDISMFKNSGLGIAFNPFDELVRESADVVIKGNDLRKVLKYILSG